MEALIVDAGMLYAQADGAERRDAAVVRLLRSERGPLITTEVVVAEATTSSFTTFDERAFRAVAPLQGGAFELLPVR